MPLGSQSDEHKAEIRKLIGELKATNKRIAAIRDGLPKPEEPMRSLMEAGYAPKDEATAIGSELDSIAENFDGRGVGSTIRGLRFALAWSSRRRRENLFLEEDLDERNPPGRLNEAEALALGETNPNEAACRLGLTLQGMDPEEASEAFLEVVCAIARLRAMGALSHLAKGVKMAELAPVWWTPGLGWCGECPSARLCRLGKRIDSLMSSIYLLLDDLVIREDISPAVAAEIKASPRSVNSRAGRAT